ncbi:hypothetical protein PLESTM_000542300, partial [Pleodorina starrii]
DPAAPPLGVCAGICDIADTVTASGWRRTTDGSLGSTWWTYPPLERIAGGGGPHLPYETTLDPVLATCFKE